MEIVRLAKLLLSMCLRQRSIWLVLYLYVQVACYHKLLFLTKLQNVPQRNESQLRDLIQPSVYNIFRAKQCHLLMLINLVRSKWVSLFTSRFCYLYKIDCMWTRYTGSVFSEVNRYCCCINHVHMAPQHHFLYGADVRIFSLAVSWNIFKMWFLMALPSCIVIKSVKVWMN